MINKIILWLLSSSSSYRYERDCNTLCEYVCLTGAYMGMSTLMDRMGFAKDYCIKNYEN